jgi:hypothetical protein
MKDVACHLGNLMAPRLEAGARPPKNLQKSAISLFRYHQKFLLLWREHGAFSIKVQSHLKIIIILKIQRWYDSTKDMLQHFQTCKLKGITISASPHFQIVVDHYPYRISPHHHIIYYQVQCTNYQNSRPLSPEDEPQAQ